MTARDGGGLPAEGQPSRRGGGPVTMKTPPRTRLRNAKGLRPLRRKVNEIKAKGADDPRRLLQSPTECRNPGFHTDFAIWMVSDRRRNRSDSCRQSHCPAKHCFGSLDPAKHHSCGETSDAAADLSAPGYPREDSNFMNLNNFYALV